MSDTPPPATAARRFHLPVEPVLIGIGLLVLLMVGYWLLITPRPTGIATSADPQRLAALEQRLAALEPLRERSAELVERSRQVAPLEARLRALEARPVPADPAARLGPLEQRLAALEQRPASADATRLDTLSARMDAQAARLQDLAKLEADHVAQLTAQLQAVGSAAAAQLQAAQQDLAPRIEALERAQREVTAMEGRMARLASLDQLRAALAGGQPLGVALARLPDPDPALTRFATIAPPTESALRLGFEDAAAQARAAAEPAQRQDGSRSSVVDSALSRLSGLVTIRRGETVVWGDVAEAEIERARRALEAGDLDAALAQLDKLPPAARTAMQGWTGQARALLAARAALRRLAAG
jgi:hypothetical protein